MNRNTSTSIEKLMFWRAGTWVKYECKTTNLFLRIHGDQLLITGDKNIFESLNMNLKIKGIYKNDVLILIVNSSQEIRKLKFQIKSSVNQCIQILGEHFPVMSHDARNSSNGSFQYRNIEEILKKALEDKDHKLLKETPSCFKNFVKLCLLDPTFPQIVFETQKILDTDIVKKTSID